MSGGGGLNKVGITSNREISYPLNFTHIFLLIVFKSEIVAAGCPTCGHSERKKKEAFWGRKPGFAVQLARGCGDPVGRHPGGRLATPLVANINDIIFFSFILFPRRLLS